MAWSTVTTTNQALQKDYLYDFASGNFTLPFNLNLLDGIETLPLGTNSIHTFDTWQPGSLGTSSSGLVSNPGSGYSVLIKAPGNLSANTDGNGLTNNITVAGQWMTRTHVIAAGGYGTYGGTLQGPYELVYNSEGSKTVDLNLYLLHNNTWQPTFTSPPGAPLPAIARQGVKSFTFNVFQQAVAVTKINNSAGATLADGTTLNDMEYGDTLTLNKSNNRGDSVTSQWTIYKQDTNGIYQIASSGVDYTLLSGTLTSDTIQVRWETDGYFKIVNRAEGQSSISSGVNYDESNLIIPIGILVEETITLPLIQTSITPQVIYTNTIVSTEPLVGIDTFTIDVSATVDTTQAEWSQTINGVTTILPMTQTTWTNELLARCNIKCQVKDGNTVVQQANGLGPHQFTLNAGEYTVGYLVTPKSGFSVFTTLAVVAAIH